MKKDKFEIFVIVFLSVFAVVTVTALIIAIVDSIN